MLRADDLLLKVTSKRDVLWDKETEEVHHMQNVSFVHGWAKFTAPREV